MNQEFNSSKQKLNFQLIKKDVESEMISRFFDNIIYLIISFVFSFLICIVPGFSNEATFIQIIIFVFIAFMCLISIFAFSLFIFGVIADFKKIINFKKGKFVIDSDILVEVKEMKHIGKSGALAKLYCFQFENSPSFESGRKKYYKWSKMFNMGVQSLYNSSLPGDEFYIILLSKSTVVIYNKKYFYIDNQ